MFKPSRKMNECPDNYWHAPRDLSGICWQVGSYGPGTGTHAFWEQTTPIRRDCPPQTHTCDDNLSIRQKLSGNNKATMNILIDLAKSDKYDHKPGK